MYGAVTMNNSLALGVFLALVYFRGLMWDFSSEVRLSSVRWSPSARCPSPLPAGTCRGIQGTKVQHVNGTSKGRHKLAPDLTGPPSSFSWKFPFDSKETVRGVPSNGPHPMKQHQRYLTCSLTLSLSDEFPASAASTIFLVSSYLPRLGPR